MFLPFPFFRTIQIVIIVCCVIGGIILLVMLLVFLYICYKCFNSRGEMKMVRIFNNTVKLIDHIEGISATLYKGKVMIVDYLHIVLFNIGKLVRWEDSNLKKLPCKHF